MTRVHSDICHYSDRRSFRRGESIEECLCPARTLNSRAWAGNPYQKCIEVKAEPLVILSSNYQGVCLPSKIVRDEGMKQICVPDIKGSQIVGGESSVMQRATIVGHVPRNRSRATHSGNFPE